MKGFFWAPVEFWFKPRVAARRWINAGIRWPLFLVAGLDGLRMVLDWDSIQGRLQAFDSVESLVEIALLLGPLLGVAALDLGALWLTLVGRVLGAGRQRFAAVRSAYALSLVPLLGNLVLILPQYAIVGERLFASGPPVAVSEGQAAVFNATVVVGLVLAAWSKIGLVFTLAEALQMTARRAAGVVLLCAAPILVMVGAFAVLSTRAWILFLIIGTMALALGIMVPGSVLIIGFIANLGKPPFWLIRRLERSRAEQGQAAKRRTPKESQSFPLVPFPRALGFSLLFNVVFLAVLFDPLLRVDTGLSEVMLGTLMMTGLALMGLSLVWHFRPDGDRYIKYEVIFSGMAIAFASKYTEHLRTPAGRAEIAAMNPVNWRAEIAGAYFTLSFWILIVGSLCALLLRWSDRLRGAAAPPSTLMRRLYFITRQPASLGAGALFVTSLAPELHGYFLLLALFFLLRYFVFERMARTPILFLRSFHDAEVAAALGRIVMRSAVRHAPVVAFAHSLQGPEQLYPRMFPEEIARMSEVADDAWQTVVIDKLQRCEAVLIDATRQTESLRWELTAARAIVPAARIAILERGEVGVPPVAVDEGEFLLRYALGWRNERRARRALRQWLKGLRRAPHNTEIASTKMRPALLDEELATRNLESGDHAGEKFSGVPPRQALPDGLGPLPMVRRP